MGLLELLIVILLICWLMGGVFSIGGSLLNVLLVIAIVLVLVRLIQGRNVI
jgi:hypothetical protein